MLKVSHVRIICKDIGHTLDQTVVCCLTILLLGEDV